MSGDLAPVLLNGRWRPSKATHSFESRAPASGEPVGVYPISPWSEVDVALDAAMTAFHILRATNPEDIATFLYTYATLIEAKATQLAEVAHRESALDIRPRLLDNEIPRTVDQLRQAAAATANRSWVEPVLSPAARIASRLAPIPGAVFVLGPNNFPFAFNGVEGGDFAAAVATGHPVLAKANPGHPETTRRLADASLEACDAAGIPPATVQLIYHVDEDDGLRIVSDRRVAATAYTGSSAGGLALKASADAAGRPIYLEMSSVNPVVLLPGSVRADPDRVARELAASALAGSGQFCTSPGLIFAIRSEASERVLTKFADLVVADPPATLLGPRIAEGLETARKRWEAAGASILRAGPSDGSPNTFPNTVMCVPGREFARNAVEFGEEAFGNMSLVIEADDLGELTSCLKHLDGNLTGTIYVSDDGSDDVAYAAAAPLLRSRVGRMLNNKMPTGVAVVGAMHHGGPFPATGHPGFTAVGIPASLRRFAMLQSFDNVLDRHLPDELKASNPLRLQRCVDGVWTRSGVTWGEHS